MATEANDGVILTTRLLDAPRELVFKAWSDRRHIAAWWGPKGFTTTTHDWDFRPGGEWNFIMHGPDGTDYKNKIVFTEIDPPSKIVFDHVSWPKFLATAIFEDVGGKTKMTYRMVFELPADFERVSKLASTGNEQLFDRLGAYLTMMA